MYLLLLEYKESRKINVTKDIYIFWKTLKAISIPNLTMDLYIDNNGDRINDVSGRS